MTPQEILAKAAEAMAERGKATGTYESNGGDADMWGAKGSVCAFGAMTLAATEGRTAAYSDLPFHYDGRKMKQLVDQAAELLAGQVNAEALGFLIPFSVVTRWNDDSSAEDVILAMKKAAHE